MAGSLTMAPRYKRPESDKYYMYIFTCIKLRFTLLLFVFYREVRVQRSNLAVGAEVGSGDLKGDLIVGEFVHLLCQKVGLSHQSVGSDNLLPEPRQTLTEEFVPVSHRQTDVTHRDRNIISFQ